MAENAEAVLRRKAQEGAAAIMNAIVELLRLHAGRRLGRPEIESLLGLESAYTTGEGGESYKGALASMLLSKLTHDGRIERGGSKGRPKVYWFPDSN
jgi:hypothetical protein